ncbi:HesB/IscA family protein [Parvibaculum sp.]|uniref:HesB/IscA family protein n=1 Tax=Parvibaculum sp. TaxID=2024848 RepID=UPI003C78C1FA
MTVSTEITAPSAHTLTDSAVRRIKRVLAKEPAGAMLRVSVEGGGCSGFQYLFDIVRDRNDDDIAIERDGAVVLVDAISVPYLEGSVLDFVDDLIGQSFRIDNPQASASCGCGTSFSI